jgi:hypothetical protein
VAREVFYAQRVVEIVARDGAVEVCLEPFFEGIFPFEQKPTEPVFNR